MSLHEEHDEEDGGNGFATCSLIGQNKRLFNQEKQAVVVVVHGLDAS